MMGKTKLSDVARAAGVSPMTVSRVLNGRGGASPDTCERIRQIADELNYRPNALARGLKSDKSRIVGVLVPDISNPFFPEIIRGIESVAMQNGYNLLLCNVDESAKREIDLMQILESQRVDGIVWCSARLPEQPLIKALQAYKAAVLVNRSVAPAIAGSIMIDYRTGAADAARHLWQTDRRRIAILAGPTTSRGAAERLEGVKTAFEALGAEPVAVVHCNPDVAGGAAASKGILTSSPDIDGIICYNDLNAVGALQTCEELGLSVPHDVSIIGFDGISLGELVRPKLSTLHVDKYSIGQLSMRMLLDRIDGKFIQHSIVIRPELTLRGSTA
ncbi:LacI family DNA-binding transcriptional regulator [Rhizobium sp. P38BS-XIX]|uniref:LacI family DNA-binding transcriptional regulator n=1 Tax=Rhizobium sp. P38BS-XIX TaxID=2726740 RepID=UPI002484918E|nr:LacI family DNA-binding transcriptional regulator [Rhizobium sp. P38BS-XIX]